MCAGRIVELAPTERCSPGRCTPTPRRCSPRCRSRISSQPLDFSALMAGQDLGADRLAGAVHAGQRPDPSGRPRRPPLRPDEPRSQCSSRPLRRVARARRGSSCCSALWPLAPPPAAPSRPRSRGRRLRRRPARPSASPAASCTCWSAAPRDTRLIVVYGYARLVGYDQELELVPDILKDVEVEDGRIFTLHLRKGHRWSDGQPFTSEDFRFWWEDVANNEALSPTGPPTRAVRRRRAAEGRVPRRADRALQLVASPTRSSCRRWRRRRRSSSTCRRTT